MPSRRGSRSTPRGVFRCREAKRRGPGAYYYHPSYSSTYYNRDCLSFAPPNSRSHAKAPPWLTLAPGCCAHGSFPFMIQRAKGGDSQEYSHHTHNIKDHATARVPLGDARDEWNNPGRTLWDAGSRRSKTPNANGAAKHGGLAARESMGSRPTTHFWRNDCSTNNVVLRCIMMRR